MDDIEAQESSSEDEEETKKPKIAVKKEAPDLSKVRGTS
jgi:hypothetical protein